MGYKHWNETAWQAHLALADKSMRYSSCSGHEYRGYFLRASFLTGAIFGGELVILNEDSGECRKIGRLDERLERHLMFSPYLTGTILETLFTHGERYAPC